MTIALALALATWGCATTSPPVELPDLRALVISDLSILKQGIEREDPVLASTIVGERFVMDNNVAVRFASGNWSSRGIGPFRSFFSKVFDNHANLSLEIELFEVAQMGDIVTARCRVRFFSTWADRSPPEAYYAEGWDWFIFENSGTRWELTGWEEAYEPEPHDQGSGTNI